MLPLSAANCRIQRVLGRDCSQPHPRRKRAPKIRRVGSVCSSTAFSTRTAAAAIGAPERECTAPIRPLFCALVISEGPGKVLLVSGILKNRPSTFQPWGRARQHVGSSHQKHLWADFNARCGVGRTNASDEVPRHGGSKCSDPSFCQIRLLAIRIPDTV
jgi:hypothetical protein